MKVHFVNVDNTDNDSVEAKQWNSHDYIVLAAFKTDAYFEKFKEWVIKLSEVFTEIYPKSIGNGYSLYYRYYKELDYPKL